MAMIGHRFNETTARYLRKCDQENFEPCQAVTPERPFEFDGQKVNFMNILKHFFIFAIKFCISEITVWWWLENNFEEKPTLETLNERRMSPYLYDFRYTIYFMLATKFWYYSDDLKNDKPSENFTYPDVQDYVKDQL